MKDQTRCALLFNSKTPQTRGGGQKAQAETITNPSWSNQAFSSIKPNLQRCCRLWPPLLFDPQVGFQTFYFVVGGEELRLQFRRTAFQIVARVFAGSKPRLQIWDRLIHLIKFLLESVTTGKDKKKRVCLEKSNGEWKLEGQCFGGWWPTAITPLAPQLTYLGTRSFLCLSVSSESWLFLNNCRLIAWTEVNIKQIMDNERIMSAINWDPYIPSESRSPWRQWVAAAGQWEYLAFRGDLVPSTSSPSLSLSVNWFVDLTHEWWLQWFKDWWNRWW